MRKATEAKETIFVDKCMVFQKEYEGLCENFETMPNQRILDNIKNGISCSKSKIEFKLESAGMRDKDKIQDSEIIPLFEAIKLSKSIDLIHTIDLSYNRITDAGAKSIASFLMNNPFIHNINLKGNDISNVGGTEIIQALITTYSSTKKNTEIALQRLNLNGNKVGDETIILLSQIFIIKEAKKLSYVDIGNCDYGHKGWTYIMTRLIENKSIQELNMENCRVNTLSHEMCTILSKVLSKNNCIKKLNISFQSDGIGNDGMEWISNSFKGNHSLETLDLSCNKIGCDGIKYLSEVLSRSKKDNDLNETCSIKYLILRGNRLTNIGARYICKILETNETLKSLDLRSCGLSDDGLYLIAETIKQLKQQKRLNLKKLLLNDNIFDSKSSNKWLSVLENRDSKILEFDFWPLIVQ